jgi:hypothetical protein
VLLLLEVGLEVVVCVVIAVVDGMVVDGEGVVVDGLRHGCMHSANRTHTGVYALYI